MPKIAIDARNAGKYGVIQPRASRSQSIDGQHLDGSALDLSKNILTFQWLPRRILG